MCADRDLSVTSAPQRILEIAFAFRKSKVLFAAVELGVFAALSKGPLELAALAASIGLNERAARDFLDALVALRLLERDQRNWYASAPDAALYLDPASQHCIGAVIVYQDRLVYPTWARLSDGLRDGKPKGGPFAAGGFDAYYANACASGLFLDAMAAGSVAPARALASRFPWERYRTFVDIGTARGTVPVELVERHPHLSGAGFDLPSLEAAFFSHASSHGVADRLSYQPGDFLVDALPPADVLLMGRILHDWGIDTRRMLIAKAYATLPDHGALVVWDALIDDDRHDSAGLLSSLNMLLQTDAGAEYTAGECIAWMREAGFARVCTMPLSGPYTAVVADKRPTGEIGTFGR